MKKIAGLFIVFGFVLVAPVLELHAQSAFEGTLNWTMTAGKEQNFTLAMHIKGDKNETDIDMGAMGGAKEYSDIKTGKIYMVMTATNTGVIMDMKDLPHTQKNDSLGLTPTGQKETIAGHPAEEYIVKGEKGDVSMWVTNDFPKDIQECFLHALNMNASQDPSQMKAMKYLADRGLTPIRIVVKVNGKVGMNMEFVKYERKSLDDALFVPPSDIKYK